MALQQQKKFSNQNKDSSLHCDVLKRNKINFNSVVLRQARNHFYYPRDRRRSKLRSERWSGPKHGMHLLHMFQQEKYWPAEHEIKDRAAVDTAALTLHRFLPADERSQCGSLRSTLIKPSQPHPVALMYLLKYCRTSVQHWGWFDSLSCFPYLCISIWKINMIISVWFEITPCIMQNSIR